MRCGAVLLVALVHIGCKDRAAGPRSSPADAGMIAAADAGVISAAAETAVAGRWISIDKEDRFHVAICALGPRPSLGSIGSPEHSATRDQKVIQEVGCPPPMPAVPAPARGRRAIALTSARLFAPTPDEVAEAGVVKPDAPAGEIVTVDQPGPTRSRVRRQDGSSTDIDNFRLIETEEMQARPGAVVVALHPQPELGVVRAFVMAGGARAMRLRGFGSGMFDEFDLVPGSFRVVGAELDPGSLVAIPLVDRVELAMVLRVAGSLIVTIDGDGRLRALHSSSAVAMPIAPRWRKGQAVFAPFVSDLAAATIAQVDDASGHVTVKWASFPDGESDWIGTGAVIDRDLSLGIYTTIDLGDP